MKEIIKTIIKDFHQRPLPECIKRNLSVPVDSRKVIHLIGPRRAGKTYFLYQLIQSLPREVRREDIVFINFEDERLNMTSDDFQRIIESYYELYPENKNPLYFFFDEIQLIAGWERFVRRLYDTVSKNIFITGSSSRSLKKEIASSLRGRALAYEVYPLTFNEFLQFKDLDGSDVSSTRNRSRIVKAFIEFLSAGGFPETVGYGDALRSRTMQSYLDVMLYRDIIERNKISNTTALKYFIKKGLANVSNALSINKLFNELKSSGMKISKDSIYEFIDAAEDCYLLFMVPIDAESIRVQNSNDKKLYCIDNGLVNNVSFKFSEDKGRMLENAVHLQLRTAGSQIFYHRGKRECDFILRDHSKVTAAIQVTTELTDQTKQREMEGLMESMKYYGLKEGIILTMDQTEKYKMEKKNIHVLPAWKWALAM